MPAIQFEIMHPISSRYFPMAVQYINMYVSEARKNQQLQVSIFPLFVLR